MYDIHICIECTYVHVVLTFSPRLKQRNLLALSSSRSERESITVSEWTPASTTSLHTSAASPHIPIIRTFAALSLVNRLCSQITFT